MVRSNGLEIALEIYGRELYLLKKFVIFAA